MLAAYEAVSETFPINHSLTRSLIIAIVIAESGDEGVGVKQLFSSIKFSQTAIRYQLNALIREGWLTSVKSGADGRTRKIKSTDKLTAAALQFSANLKSLTAKFA